MSFLNGKVPDEVAGQSGESFDTNSLRFSIDRLGMPLSTTSKPSKSNQKFFVFAFGILLQFTALELGGIDGGHHQILFHHPTGFDRAFREIKKSIVDISMYVLS